ncbi:glycoside hydrolase family 5 protein [Viridothelium virens]|uniref:mannan endo-1,4-beta-mannosidase n=1 Tax=Viridothelium virens TaxID=1048519 RepID=A0A6A6H3V7_VIRVR|nr:glycoside hydrolase family 5 protein [Viridothelium virens]
MKFFLFALTSSLAMRGAVAAQSFIGNNLYYADGLPESAQDAYFQSLQSAGVKVLRVWLDGETGDQKGTKINPFPPLESQIGQYDDKVLENIDDLMVTALKYKIKIHITIYSQNSLRGGDCYSSKYGQTGFYTTSDAKQALKNRIAHVLSHVDSKTGNKWADSGDRIFGFEAMNEAFTGLSTSDFSQYAPWQCEMATAINGNSSSGSPTPLVMTGGGNYVDVSLESAYFTCPDLNVLGIHAYGDGDLTTSKLQPYVSKAQQNRKKLILEEWGVCYFSGENSDCPSGSPQGDDARIAKFRQYADAISQSGIPWWYWQFIPNADPHEGSDYEIGTQGDDALWNAVKEVGSQTAGKYQTPFDFSEWLIQ